MERQRTLRVGLTAILCALVFRMFSAGIPGKLAQRLIKPDTAPVANALETGQDVRFSPSLEGFSPFFMESPPAVSKEVIQPPLPAFSDAESLGIYNISGKTPDIAALLEKPLTWNLRREEPTVLILHTHSTESYTKNGETYQETSSWRTADENYNMLSIGAYVKTLLEAEGIITIQDRQLHDYPSYNGSYTHARQTIRAYLEAYPSIRLVLDLHRDASSGSGAQLRTLAAVDGKAAAQIMLVLGTNHEGYEENLSLALKLQAQLESQNPGITRPLQLRTSRFNQDLCAGSLLIEVGAAGNTHAEGLLAAYALAEAVIALSSGTL